jgi:glycosyltransferase involved in cell wall biosynthesis
MKAIALLGRRDELADGVADYCRFLAQALQEQDIELEIVRVPWADHGWSEAMQWLSRESRNWSGRWVLLQYTSLSWSRRGFPFRALAVQRMLEKHGAKCAVVFHDVRLVDVPRIRDRIRRRCQYWVMRRLLARSKQSIITAPRETLPWVPARATNLNFIPIGANIPEPNLDKRFDPDARSKTIGVFCISNGQNGKREVQEILFVAERVKARVPALHLEIFGRGAEEAAPLLEAPLRNLGISLRLRGILPAEEITRTLQSMDAYLCVRGEMTTNRGSALAAITCGIPMVAFGERGRYHELDAAGIEFVPWGALEPLADSMTRVLTDPPLWLELHERSRRAQSEYFSWQTIAARFAAILRQSETQPE